MPLDYKKFKETIENMSPEEKATAVLLYLKDIKDILQSLAEHLNTPLKHY